MKLLPKQNDDMKFIDEIEGLISTITVTHNLSPICVIKTDNWFDHKWLGHSKCKIPRSWKSSKGFISDRGLPGFPKDRILYTDFYELKNHELVPLDETLFTTSCKGCFFYSGNTLANKRGSLMVYLSINNDQYWFWYLSYLKNEEWKVIHYKGISEREVANYKKG